MVVPRGKIYHIKSCCAINRKEEEHEKLQYKKNIDTMLVRTQYNGKHFCSTLYTDFAFKENTY